MIYTKRYCLKVVKKNDQEAGDLASKVRNTQPCST